MYKLYTSLSPAAFTRPPTMSFNVFSRPLLMESVTLSMIGPRRGSRGLFGLLGFKGLFGLNGFAGLSMLSGLAVLKGFKKSSGFEWVGVGVVDAAAFRAEVALGVGLACSKRRTFWPRVEVFN
jgi:hypothetical protein